MLTNEKLFVDLRGNCFKFVEAHIDGVKNKIEISKFGCIRFSDEYLSDGIIKNNESTRKIITNFIKKEKIKAKKVYINISHPSIILRIVKVPAMSENDLTDYLKLEISQYLPIDIETNVYDFKTLETVEEEDKKMISIILAALPKDIIQNYTALFKNTKLYPVSVDVYPSSVSKLFGTFEDYNLAIFEVNNNEIDFLIIKNGKLFMYTNVSLENTLNLTVRINEGIDLLMQEDAVFATAMNEITTYLRTYLNFFSSKHFG
ncbi:MAG: pilus assembly protein PilM, partial [bacterium]|nr:pilus assembly protein PilM [bacterium]